MSTYTANQIADYILSPVATIPMMNRNVLTIGDVAAIVNNYNFNDTIFFMTDECLLQESIRTLSSVDYWRLQAVLPQHCVITGVIGKTPETFGFICYKSINEKLEALFERNHGFIFVKR